MKPTSGTWPGRIVRVATTFQAVSLISDTVHEPSPFTDSTYATWPEVALSRVIITAPTLGTWPSAYPYEGAVDRRWMAVPNQGMASLVATYQVLEPKAKQ